MELFVLRHGQAETMARRDQDRQLTPLGRRQVSNIVNANRSSLESLGHMLVSPYIRAQQTADIVADTLALQLPNLETQTTELLTPEGNIDALCRLLEPYSEQSVLLVSHQPLVGTFVNWLCCLVPGRYNMGTATLACIDTELLVSDFGQLRWLCHPESHL